MPIGLGAVSLASLLIVSGSVSSFVSDESWTYEAPNKWADVSPSYEACRAGDMQSPIDLAYTNAVANVDMSLNYNKNPLNVLNNGHTIQANFLNGSSITSGERAFALVQVHFHTPSEHLISGKSYPLVAHFVHVSQDGALAVVGVMFDEGHANAELQKIIDAAPKEKAEARTLPNVMLDPNKLLPDEVSVFRYMGSLTTPPCSEGVNWHVVEKSAEASAEQIKAFADIMGNNARPIMPLNNRLLVKPE